MKASQHNDKGWIANVAQKAAFAIGAIAGVVLITKSAKSPEKLPLRD